MRSGAAKYLSPFMLGVALVGLAAATPPQSQARFVASSLYEEDCEVLSLNEEEASSTSLCGGPSRYQLLVLDGDARQSITIVRPDGTELPLNFWSVVTGGFSSVGWEAEWRMAEEGSAARPTALIVPLNAHEWRDGDDGASVTYLVVAKITPTGACVTDALVPAAHQIERARRLAASAGERPCLVGYSERAVEPPLGRHCFARAGETETSNVLLSVDTGGSFRGRNETVIHVEADGYFTSYAQRFEGVFERVPDNLGRHNGHAEVTTWIEYDVQASTEQWTLASDRLLADGAEYGRVACDDEFPVHYPEEVLGIEETPTDTFEATLSADSTAILANSVVRGFRDRWYIDLPGGALVQLRISSVENNAAFDVIDPSGIVLAKESFGQELILPHDGRYEIIVGGTRGNASYELEVAVPERAGVDAAAARAQTQNTDCDVPLTTVDMVTCIGLEFEAAERLLEDTVAASLATLDSEGQSLFMAAQAAWTEYREAECLRARDVVRGGTMAAVLGGTCLVDLTNRRTHAILGEVGPADPVMPEGSVFWSAADPLVDEFFCEVPELARVGLAPGFDPEGGGATLAVRLQVGAEFLDFSVGAGTQSSFCGADVRIETVPGEACPMIRMDDGMCDAITVFWDPESLRLEWTRR